MAYRILSIDGGGFRGLFTARLLERLEWEVPGFLERFDLVAGTSTGAILALGVAAGLTLAELVLLYLENGRKIFDDSWLDNLKDFGQIIGAQYDNRRLKRLLEDTFAKLGKRTLSDLEPRRVLVPAFDLDDGQDPHRKPDKPRSWKPKFFHNFPGEDSDGAESIVDVLMRSCAAPTYFPSYGRYIDGGVVANNPAMAAIAQALSTHSTTLPEVHLLSLGTGFSPSFIAGKNHDWGFAQWVRPLIDLLMDGSMGVADYQCRQLLGPRYHRLTHALTRRVPLDDYKQADYLLKVADKEVDIAETVAWIRKYL